MRAILALLPPRHGARAAAITRPGIIVAALAVALLATLPEAIIIMVAVLGHLLLLS
jgi:hypothetical protein